MVLPSLTSAEAYGLVLAEGMAAGCVPVASDLPGVREVAGPTGVLVRPGDIAGLRAALVGLSADAGRLAELSAASVVQAAALSIDSNAARHEQIFRRAISARRLPRAVLADRAT